MLKWSTILLGVAGAAMGIYVVSTNSRPEDMVAPPPAAPPSVNPFGHGIAATGQVEASSRNLTVSAPEGAVVMAVFHQVGERVKKDEPLFELDTRLLKADLRRAEAALESAKAQLAVAQARLARINASPRAEEIPPLEANVARAQANVRDQEQMLTELSTAGAGLAASANEIDRRKWAVEMAKAELVATEAQLALTRAGAWQPDKLVSQAEVQQAESGVKEAEAAITAIQLRIERLTVRSPISGLVLKRNVEPGQFAPTGAGTQAAFVVGDVNQLHVRARVDEEDAPLLRDGAAGAARVRGISAETIPLKWLRVEPLAQPKTDLTGSNTERVDTRVVEVLFQIEGTPKSRLFPGQVVDVYIQTGE